VAREKGILEDWHDARGFGFIRRPDGAGKLYVHMKAIGKSNERPKAGDILSTKSAQAPMVAPRPSTCRCCPRQNPRLFRKRRRKRPLNRAQQHRALIPRRAANPKPALSASRCAPPPPPPSSCCSATTSCWIASPSGSACSTSSAVSSRGCSTRQTSAPPNAAQWREPERLLHLADLAFGIVGGLLAQHVLRHKTYKPGFVMVTALITALHVLTLGLPSWSASTPPAPSATSSAAFSCTRKPEKQNIN